MKGNGLEKVRPDDVASLFNKAFMSETANNFVRHLSKNEKEKHEAKTVTIFSWHDIIVIFL
jgi:hypothetical protein